MDSESPAIDPYDPNPPVGTISPELQEELSQKAKRFDEAFKAF